MTEHKSLAEALAAFQAHLPAVARDARAIVKSDKGSYTYDYAGLDVVSLAVLPRLAEHGLSFSAKPTVIDGKFVLEYVLRHTSGDEDRGVYPLPVGARPQEVGSALTYSRRYVLLAMSGVFPGGEDDDGRAAQETRVEAAPAEQEVQVTQSQHRRMQALWKDLGYGGDANRDQRLTITAKIVGMEELVTSATLTARQAAQVIDALERKKREAEAKAHESN